MINYKLIGFTMSYGQPNPVTYYYMVDDRLKIKNVKRYLERRFNWMKVINIVEPPPSCVKITDRTQFNYYKVPIAQIGDKRHYIWGYFTQKDTDGQKR